MGCITQSQGKATSRQTVVTDMMFSLKEKSLWLTTLANTDSLSLIASPKMNAIYAGAFGLMHILCILDENVTEEKIPQPLFSQNMSAP